MPRATHYEITTGLTGDSEHPVPYHRIRSVVSKTLKDTTVTLALDPSPEHTHYSFRITAWSDSEQIGMLRRPL